MSSKLPGLKWFLPSRYEVRHPLKWTNRVIHCRTVYPFDTMDFASGVDKFLRSTIYADVDLSGDIVDIVDVEALGGHDFSYAFRSDLLHVDQVRFITRVDGSPWLVGYRGGQFRTLDTFGPWLPTCMFSECCDAPVYLRHSFLQMRAFHWCPACENLITQVDDEFIFDMNQPDFDPSLLDSKQPAE